MGIRLENVSYSYNKKKKGTVYALKNITLSIDDKDEFIALIGETGSGKSTLASLFNALKIPSSGEEYVFGIKIQERRKRKENYNDIRKHVGLVFQFPEYQLFEETVLKDVMFAPRNFGKSKEEAEKIAVSALEMVHFPKEMYDKTPFTLSGGEKKMVSIAGILSMEPDILIFDEPTAGIDPENRNKLTKLFKDLNEQAHKTIIIITHDMNIVSKYAKRVIVMSDGEVAFDGTPEKLFESSEDQIASFNLDYPDSIKIAKYLNEKAGLNLNPNQNDLNSLIKEILS